MHYEQRLKGFVKSSPGAASKKNAAGAFDLPFEVDRALGILG